MTDASPAVVEFARGLGIDLISGHHEPFAAEAARVAGLELLHLPRWNRADLGRFLAAQQTLIAEEQREIARWTRVRDEMLAHGLAVAGQLPQAVLCRIFECSPEQVGAILDAPLPDRWWWQ